MVKDAARVETPVLRVVDACYGFKLKRNMPAPKGPMALADSSKLASKQDPPSVHKKVAPVDKRPDRPADRSRPRNRSPRGPRKHRGVGCGPRRSCSRRRSALSTPADYLLDKHVRDERLSAWFAGEYGKGSLRDKCKNCYIGLGAHVPRRAGRPCQDLHNRCLLPRRAPVCESLNARHWARRRSLVRRTVP